MIHFFIEESEQIPSDFKVKSPLKTKKWLKQVIQSEGFELKELNYVFCDDAYLLKINVEYLEHDTLTDIITFDNSEDENSIEGEIYISIERVKENAAVFQTTFEQELLRVMVHGVLHLCGYLDKSDEDELLMRSKENEKLALFSLK